MTKLLKLVFTMAFLAAIVSCQLFEKDDTTPSSGWLGGLFHHNGKPDSSLPESMEWSTEVPTSSTPSSYWSYFSLGHHTTPSSLLRLRRAAQGQYGYRPYNRPYNRYPNQAYNQGGNRPYYYQRPIETTTPPKNIYMPGNGPAMPVASSTFPPQFGLGVTYKNGATVKPTTSTANPAAAWYSNWLNSLPDSVKSLYGVTTTKPPQGLVGRRRRSLSRLARRRRSAEEDMASSIEGSSLHNHGHHHHHHHEDTSPAPEIENSTADAEASTQGLRNKLRRKRSAEEEEVSTRTPCHHKHSPAPHMMEEISRRRRSAEEDMASTECSSLHHHHRHHHHEDASQAPEIASSPSALSRRRRSAEDLASTEGLTDALDLSTESTTTTDDSSEDASTEPILKVTKTKPRFRRAVEEIKSSTQGPISMIAIEGLNETSTASDQEMKLSTSAPTLR